MGGVWLPRTVKKLMTSLLLCNWQETVSEYAPKPDGDEMESSGECHSLFDIWKKSYFKTCSAIDYQLSQLPGIDSFYSGSTALTIAGQGDLIVVANVGDSRAVLATTDDDGRLVPVQLTVDLTVDLKPNLPRESKRITQSNGRIHSSKDEPGVYRVWMPNGNTLQGPGLAILRDQFVIFATDAVLV